MTTARITAIRAVYFLLPRWYTKPKERTVEAVKETIMHLLGQTNRIGREVLCFEELDSTNTYLKQLALSGAADGTAVIAACQTAGRGRMDRTFQSPAGKGLYLSVLLRPELPPERFLPVTALAGIAVCTAVEKLCGVRPGLKWPNDPVLQGRKLAGVLTELVVGEDGKPAIVLGIGVNLSQQAEDFTADVAAIATSLAAEGYPVAREVLAAALLKELDGMYGDLLRGDLECRRQDYRRDCVNIGKAVQLLRPDGRREQAEALDIDEDFGLAVRLANGREEIIRTGEVSVRGLYGYVE